MTDKEILTRHVALLEADQALTEQVLATYKAGLESAETTRKALATALKLLSLPHGEERTALAGELARALADERGRKKDRAMLAGLETRHEHAAAAIQALRDLVRRM